MFMSGITSNRYERNLIVALLIFFVLIPLPLGSNRLWAMGSIVMIVGVLSCLWALGLWRGKVRPGKALKAGLPLFFVLLAAQVWVAATMSASRP